MKLTARGEYALRALLVLAQRSGPEVVPVEVIATEQNLPNKYVVQILADLKASGLVESRRGKFGGFRLARPPASVSLAEIVRHVDGALAPVGCVSERFYEKCSCPDESRCAIRSVMKQARDAVAQVMEATSLADMVTRTEQLRRTPMQAPDFEI